MKMSAALTGCTVFKSRDVGLFAFEPFGRHAETVFRVLLGSQWQHYKIEPKWAAIGMAGVKYTMHPDFVVVAASAEGHLWEMTPGANTERETRIGGDYDGLTKLAAIGDAIWACGMGRLVLRRESNGTWTNVSAPDPTLDEGVIGFNSIAGTTAGEVVTVGWNGEIWMRVADRWEAQESGTNTNLNAVSVSASGEVVAVGDVGTVIVGRRDQWSVLDINTDFNLQGVCHFGQEVFVCSDFELFRLEKGALVTENRFADGVGPKTCMNLLPGKDNVFSQGEKDIFRYAEGIWTRVF
jgi:hypothetical protein